ncbi:alpha-L-fucosidase [Flavobacterium akiainvivens]|uniref:alpha-L-fucosidase n=1 Tax=Flavobacterium akiainvivens TaxID=1202724 RepID=A0A0M8MJC3_9FLAO|nr:alpha-L-fucosidase [Flavobacterium akiainvivens]KOS06748.1 alpha-L-fucosidase [Flavobacterium akiainvivens]SFQ74361.1 alpha-L-fucosidase [Flavobacterium akiainvivens]
MKRIILLSSILALTACSSKKGVPVARHYEPTWESLAQYDQSAEWFKDAKFGIYAHWGVLSVPAYANDWYPRNMHVLGTDENKHQVETYGPLNKFGYHDFVPMFKAEQFNANEWADLMVQAGAKFGGVVAEHHDGWSNWASKINPWNSMDKGPHRDIVGELATAIHGRGLKLVTSFHKDRNLQINNDNPEKWLDDESYFPYNPDMFTSSTDPEIRMMYGNMPKEQFYKNWLGELKELIDNYSPDLIYFDSKMTKIPESYKQQFLAHYFNHSVAQKKQVIVTHKEGELPKTVSLEDFEKGRMDRITPEFWLTDETVSVGSWSYTNTLGLKTADEIIDLLADIVSKNGTMMLNISPKADGSIPQNQKDILVEIGNWLKTNGEAIYASRTWATYGEGPTKIKGGMFVDKVSYTAQDVRYTRKGNTVYAIVLGWPGENKPVVFEAFSGKIFDAVPKVKSVTVLATGEKRDFKQDDEGLHVTTPAQKVDDKAFVFKIEVE